MAVKLKEELLALAADATHTRIRRDGQRVSAKLQPLLDYVDKHLFDPDLDVNQLKRACGVRNTATVQQFRTELRERPHFYITRCRVETAQRLLRDTKLRIGEIAELVGYQDARGLSRGYQRIQLETPSEYRVRIREEVSSRIGRDLRSLEVWREAHDGKLEVYEVAALVEHFQKLYSLDTEAAPLSWPTDGVAYERYTAGEVWERIKDQPIVVQHAALRRQARFSTSALFDLLRRKSREAGRKDREEGVQLAELAIVSLEGSAEMLGEKVPALKARGWAWLGNARRLAHDFAGAEEALRLAETSWASPLANKDRLVEGEICFVKSCLRLFQRRFDKALELASRSIKLFRSLEEFELLAQALVQRANTNCHSGKPKRSVADLREAIEALDGNNDRYSLFSAYSSLATTYTRLGRIEEATELLPIAKKLCAEVDGRRVRYQLRWSEALVCNRKGDTKTAEKFLVEAREGLSSLSEPDYSALVSLDLAILLMRQGRVPEVLAILMETMPVIDALSVAQEAVVAIRLLKEAVSSDNLSLPVLLRARLSIL